MMREYPDIQSWARAVRSGEVVLAAGSHLSFAQMAALGMHCDLAGDARTGAPGSRASLDASAHEKKMTLAAQALQREHDIAAAASCTGTPQEHIQATLEHQMRTGNAWERLEHQRQHHVYRNAGLSPEHGVHAALERQRLPQVQATGASDDIGSRFTRRIADMFRDAEVPLGEETQQASRVERSLIEIRERLDRVEALLQKWLGETAHPDRVQEPLAAVRQIRQQIRSLVAVA